MELFVFPLGHVLLYPASSKPVYIFEPQYVQMVRDSLASGVPIAVGFVDEPDREHLYRPGEPLHFVRSVVGYGKPWIVEEKPDGSMVVFLQGQGKARLGPVVKRKTPYIVCEAEEISENHDILPANYTAFMQVHKILVHWMHQHIPDTQTRHQFLDHIKTPEEVVGCYASYIVADHDMQQLILEYNDINEKMRLIQGLIASGEIV